MQYSACWPSGSGCTRARSHQSGKAMRHWRAAPAVGHVKDRLQGQESGPPGRPLARWSPGCRNRRRSRRTDRRCCLSQSRTAPSVRLQRTAMRWSTSAAMAPARASTAPVLPRDGRRQLCGRAEPLASQHVVDQDAGRRLVAVQLRGPRRAALIAAVYGNGRVEPGEGTVAFAAGQEERQTDGDGLRGAQLFQDLQGGQPGDGALPAFLPPNRPRCPPCAEAD